MAGICFFCKHWDRAQIEKDPDLIDSKLIPSAIGACKAAVHVVYWEGVLAASEKITDGKMGGDTIFTNQDFGCNRFDTIVIDKTAKNH